MVDQQPPEAVKPEQKPGGAAKPQENIPFVEIPYAATYIVQHLLWVPQAAVQKVAQYSIGLFVTLNALGFIVTGLYYSRAGVGPSSIPITAMASAGLSCALFTVLFSFIGYAIGSGERIGRRLELALFGFSAAAVFTVIIGGSLRYWEFGLIHALLTYRLGARARKSRITGKPAPPDGDPFGLVFYIAGPITFAVLFGMILYPALERSVGGAKPQPVEIEWRRLENATPFIGKRLYSIYEDNSWLYLGLLNNKTESWSERNLEYLEHRLEYVAVAKSDVALVRYLHDDLAVGKEHSVEAQADAGPAIIKVGVALPDAGGVSSDGGETDGGGTNDAGRPAVARDAGTDAGPIKTADGGLSRE